MSFEYQLNTSGLMCHLRLVFIYYFSGGESLEFTRLQFKVLARTTVSSDALMRESQGRVPETLDRIKLLVVLRLRFLLS